MKRPFNLYGLTAQLTRWSAPTPPAQGRGRRGRPSLVPTPATGLPVLVELEQGLLRHASVLDLLVIQVVDRLLTDVREQNVDRPGASALGVILAEPTPWEVCTGADYMVLPIKKRPGVLILTAGDGDSPLYRLIRQRQ